jgi:hypothetical protein
VPAHQDDLFPKIYWRGFHKNSLVTIEEKLGPNLKEIFLKYHYAHFSVPTICLIAIQVVRPQ